MEYKTPMIAEMMGVSPKVVKRIVRQLNIELKQNKLGHYIFNEEDMQQIQEQYAAEQEAAAAALPAGEFASLSQLEELQQQIAELRGSRQKPDSAADSAQFVPLEQFRALQAEVEALRKQPTPVSAVSEETLHALQEQVQALQPAPSAVSEEAFHALQEQVQALQPAPSAVSEEAFHALREQMKGLQTPPPAVSGQALQQLQEQLEALVLRIERNEEYMRGKADDVVNYQLLQHRREMEEMQQRIHRLEEAVAQLEARKIPVPPAGDFPQIKKPKRRSAIFSVFGL
ncbi:hypothetical protein NK662_11880 [Ectobacillus sp. SYSU M60031]|uniref:Chromosome-anchoring protein RacA n=1 Tax=Ectobacillus ponti TaxID=2961894 RepID=A0AA42BT97_9BACI|nr:hypothetical protein [Ectobacillus ponti]MCP8969238.1 hypothetical protein [Ectobacillus ponti]